MTFLACGALHDSISTAVRGSLVVFFTPWFFFLGVGVVVTTAAGMDVSRFGRTTRVTLNVLYLGICLGLGMLARSLLGIG